MRARWATSARDCSIAVVVSAYHNLAETRMDEILTDDVVWTGRSKVDYENVLADSEREAVADLLNYLENVMLTPPSTLYLWLRMACISVIC
jgi:hypothetical protein